jgi:hypothetical protein
MIAKRLFLDLTPSDWHGLVAKTAQLGAWSPASGSRLALDLAEERLAAVGKKDGPSVILTLLGPAVDVLEEYIPAMEEAACEKNTFDSLQRQLKDEINHRLEVQSEIEKQKERYEANLKKMMMLVDKLNVALKAKEEHCLALETVES